MQQRGAIFSFIPWLMMPGVNGRLRLPSRRLHLACRHPLRLFRICTHAVLGPSFLSLRAVPWALPALLSLSDRRPQCWAWACQPDSAPVHVGAGRVYPWLGLCPLRLTHCRCSGYWQLRYPPLVLHVDLMQAFHRWKDQ